MPILDFEALFLRYKEDVESEAKRLEAELVRAEDEAGNGIQAGLCYIIYP